jgi:hypothetical protein
MSADMKKILLTSCATLWTLTLVAGCGGGGNHADANKPDSGGDTGGGGGSGGTDAGTDGGGGGGGTDAGTDGGGTCTASGTCGGDIVGTWNVTTSCLDVDVSGAIPDYCPTATAQPMGFQLKGTISYKANLTYSRQSTISGGVVITYPAACLAGGDGGAPSTCDQLATQLKLDLNYTSVACVTAGTGCTCTGTFAPQTQTKTGMYTTTSAAGLLVESETGRATPDMSDYCITGDTLTMSPHAMGSPASGNITATRVQVPDAGTDAVTDAAGDAKPEAGTDGGSDASDASSTDASTGN